MKTGDDYQEILGELIKSLDGSPILEAQSRSDARKVREQAKEIQRQIYSYLNPRLLSLKTVPIEDQIVTRAVKSQYQSSPLSWQGSFSAHGRWHNKNTTSGAIYFSESASTITHELAETFKNFQILTFPAKITLKRYLDLERKDHLEAIELLKRFIFSEWRVYTDVFDVRSPTHWITKALTDLGFEALRFESARHRGCYNRVIFPKNLRKGSLITLVDPHEDQKPTTLTSENLDQFDIV